MNVIILFFVLKYRGDWNLIYEALQNKEKVTLEEIQNLERKIALEKWKVISILDYNYPESLKSCYKPPFAIFYKGNDELFKSKFIALSGNQVTDNARAWIVQYVPIVEKRHHIVTGMFKGIDEEIAGYAKAGRLIVAASGLDAFKGKLEELDLLISEYPPVVSPKTDNFRKRNRIIAAFAESLVLFTSEKNGGINHLVSCFLNAGKEIYCFPGDGGDKDGNSELIKQGATLITSIQDISS